MTTPMQERAMESSDLSQTSRTVTEDLHGYISKSYQENLSVKCLPL